jgi:hypothetical protein
LDSSILNAFFGLLSRCVGASIYIPASAVCDLFRGWLVHTDLDGTERNHGTIDFVDDAIDFLKIVGVRDNLVTGDDILYQKSNVNVQFSHRLYLQMKMVSASRIEAGSLHGKQWKPTL